MMSSKVLIIDDEEFVRWPLKRRLNKEGFSVLEAGTGEEGLATVHGEKVNLVILDLKLPDGDGVSILKSIRASHPDLPVLMMTAFGSIDTAVEALKLGAFDYISKPCNLEELILLIKKALEMSSLKQEVQSLRSRVPKQGNFGNLIGRSTNLTRIVRRLTRSTTRRQGGIDAILGLRELDARQGDITRGVVLLL